MSRLARAIGRPSIHPVAFTIAKLSVAVSWGIFLLEVLRQSRGFALLPVSFAIPLIVAGAALAIAGVLYLGESLRVGLPQEETRLRCKGVYRITRNPIYLGIYLTVAGSALAVPTPLNIVAAGAAVVLHHMIVLSEERFLAERFGTEWEEYRRRVPRYLWRR